MPEITLPDKSKRKFKNSISVEELAMDIGSSLAKATVAGKINDVLVDASEIISEDAKVEFIQLTAPMTKAEYVESLKTAPAEVA